jgi:hypothetical protein
LNRFPPTSLSVGCPSGQETFGGTHGNGRDAPISDLDIAAAPYSSYSRSGPGASTDRPVDRAFRDTKSFDRA